MTNKQHIQGLLIEQKDDAYRQFQIKLIPNVDPQSVIGVRTPQLRKLAKQLAGTPEAREFMTALPHDYFDENCLHGLLLETIVDFDDAIEAIDAFLPYIDNWATCDIISPKRLAKSPEKLLVKIREWIGSRDTYTIRFGIETLMSFFLDERFEGEYLDWVADLRSDEYYVNMMIAWFFATALAKQYDQVIPYIENRRLDDWTHNKTIQKAVESYRITDEQKACLRSLKVKKPLGNSSVHNN